MKFAHIYYRYVPTAYNPADVASRGRGVYSGGAVLTEGRAYPTPNRAAAYQWSRLL